MDYLIKTGEDPEDLAANVKLGIMHGWTPIGGVCFGKDMFYDADSKDMLQKLVWAQAMVRNDIPGAKMLMDSAIQGCSVCGEIGCAASCHHNLEG